MAGEHDDTLADEPLELENGQIVEGDNDDEPEGHEPADFAFAGDDESEDEADTPVVRRLRDQLKQTQRQLREVRHAPAPIDDPEPQIPEKPDLEAMNWDMGRFNTATDARDEAIIKHAEWKARAASREADARRAEADQTRRIEQQRASLNVPDYIERAETVKEALSDQQFAVLAAAAENAPRMIAALARSPARLATLAAEDNLARFAFTLGRMDTEIKSMKGKAPPPESRVRGATASLMNGKADKELERLRAAADKTGDRTAVAAHIAAQKEAGRMRR